MQNGGAQKERTKNSLSVVSAVKNSQRHEDGEQYANSAHRKEAKGG